VRIKLDENLPSSLVGILKGYGHDADTVWDEGIAGRNDEIIWQYAQADQRFLITLDLDFSDIRKFAPGTHRGILLVRLNMPSRREIEERVRSLFATERVEQWNGAFIVATDRKIRVTLPRN
jgi:predicted nuclease of predicted toxin-antitoxin system